MELVDQLFGSDMPLEAMMGLFATEADARRVIARYLEKGVVSLLEGGAPLPLWRALGAVRDTTSGELQARGRILALTDKGARAFEAGTWERI